MKTLRGKINFFFLILSAIIILVFTAFQIVKVRSLLLERGIESAHLIARMIAIDIAEQDSIDTVVNRLKRFVPEAIRLWNLKHVQIREGSRSVYSFTKPQKDEEPDQIYIFRVMNMSDYLIMKNSIQVQTPVSLHGMEYELIIRLSLNNIKKEMNSIFVNYMIISFVIFSLVYFITNFLSRIIVGPIRALSSATRDILAGDYREIQGMDTETELGDLVRAFNKMVRNLKKTMEENKLAMIGKMSAGLAHEIRNPLVSIQGLTEVLLEDTTNPQTRQDMEIIIKEVKRLNLFIEDLLQFSRPRHLEFRKNSLEKIMAEALIMMKHEMRKKNIEVIQDWESIQEVNVDPNALKQVFLNLLFNAIQFSEDGSQISVKGYFGNEQKSLVKVEIADKGCGIPPDSIKSIFEPFFSTRKGGSGLGLAIVKRLMQAHEGDIDIVSREEMGTTVIIYIPIR